MPYHGFMLKTITTVTSAAAYLLCIAKYMFRVQAQSSVPDFSVVLALLFCGLYAWSDYWREPGGFLYKLGAIAISQKLWFNAWVRPLVENRFALSVSLIMILPPMVVYFARIHAAGHVTLGPGEYGILFIPMSAVCFARSLA